MRNDFLKKYQPYPFRIEKPNRSWPNKTITKSPIWCSVDLRDGNQALVDPMTVNEKLIFFKLLVDLGFKEIEVGFPSASLTDFQFTRRIIEEKLIPDDVAIQVLVQCRPHLIARSFEAIAGAKNVIFHFYNSTSELQRRVVFKKDKNGIKDIALLGANLVFEGAKNFSGNLMPEYSPESFTGTEIDFTLEVCEAVQKVFSVSKEKPIIFNLPSTVEMSTPNAYADLIEYFHENIPNRDGVILSLHTHNDRGTGVAASELGLLAGADRIEGTLLGNGERTGNADLLCLALNLYSQGIDPELDLHDLDRIIQVYEQCNKMKVHERSPYAGSLVYAAFSGSHQDAIRKGFAYQKQSKSVLWQVPYLPIDPSDLGRTYESVIRINSQSGKGGVAFILEREYGLQIPKEMHFEISRLVQDFADATGKEVTSEEIFAILSREYINQSELAKHVHFSLSQTLEQNLTDLKWTIITGSKERTLKGLGNGPLHAACDALQKSGIVDLNILNFFEHSLSEGSDSEAVSYIEAQDSFGNITWGVGKSRNSSEAPILALLSCVNRLLKMRNASLARTPS